MAQHSEDRGDDVAPKGGHASANPEPTPPRGHAQRGGEDSPADDALQGTGEDGGARSDADRKVADVDVDRGGLDTGTRPQSGSAQDRRTGG